MVCTFNLLVEQLHASLVLSSCYLFCSYVAGAGVALLSAVLGQGTLFSQGLSVTHVQYTQTDTNHQETLTNGGLHQW